MAKIRVYELARELGKDNKTLEQVIKGLGIPIKNYMSTLSVEEASQVRRKVGGASAAAAAAPSSAAASGGGSGGSSSGPARRRKSGGGVVRRRKASGPRPAEKERERQEQEDTPETAAAAESRPVVRRGVESRRAAREAARDAGGDARQVVRRSAQAQSDGASGSAGSAGSDGSSGMQPDGTADGEAASGPGGPAVGQRIELPRNTRRLPGGMLERMEKERTVRPPRGSEATRGRAPVPSRPEAEVRARSERAEEAEAEAEATPTAETPTPAASAREAHAEAKPAAEEPEGKGKGESDGESGGVTEEVTSDGRRVLRNEDGVIVGVKTKQSGPKIVDFIQLEPRRPARPQVIITEAKKGPGGGRATARKLREEKAQSISRRRKPGGRGRRYERRDPPQRTMQEMSEAKKRIRVDEAIQVSDLAHQMSQKASKLLRVLWGMGMRGVTINNSIDFETAELVAAEFGYTVENVAFDEEEIVSQDTEGAGEIRPPVVTVMGHVDHGKTSLLDYIRKARVAAGEAGGITQHVGAYKVPTKHGDVVFLDTPGHEAFSAMRERGAQITDITVLIVAADDGVMPTTIEAINHCRDADVPMVVAINKIDKPEANPGRVKQMLMEYGLVGEEFGGDTPIAELSAKTGQGVDELLELLAIQAEVMDLRAHDDGRATGTVIEARIDKGRGTVATVLVQNGTLKKGDVLVANEFSGKVRGMFDDLGTKMKEAGPGTPVEVLGLDGVPSAGDRFDVVENDRGAKTLIAHRRDKRRRKESVRSAPSVLELIAKKRTPTLKVVLRADVQGSAEALKQALEELSTDKVKVEVIFTGVGAIIENDVTYASAGEAVVIGFNVKPVGKAGPLADSEKVPIHLFNIIYEATEQVTELMIDLLEPEYREKPLGEAEVRALFPIPKLGTVAGCRVLKGKITRHAKVRVLRQGKVVHEGQIGSLRVFKDDVREVGEGQECGIVVQGFAGVEPEDIIEAFELETLRPTL